MSSLQTQTQQKTLVIVSSLAPNMFVHTTWDIMQRITIKDEEELKKLLSGYDNVISYIRHPSTVGYLTQLRSDIKVVSDENAEYKYHGEDILTVALAKRPPKGAKDISISGFSDLAIVFYKPMEMVSF